MRVEWIPSKPFPKGSVEGRHAGIGEFEQGRLEQGFLAEQASMEEAYEFWIRLRLGFEYELFEESLGLLPIFWPLPEDLSRVVEVVGIEGRPIAIGPFEVLGYAECAAEFVGPVRIVPAAARIENLNEVSERGISGCFLGGRQAWRVERDPVSSGEYLERAAKLDGRTEMTCDRSRRLAGIH